MVAQPLTTADVLEACATRMHSAAFDWREPARTHSEVELRIAEVELICANARAAVRGGARREPVGRPLTACERERRGGCPRPGSALSGQRGGRGGSVQG